VIVYWLGLGINYIPLVTSKFSKISRLIFSNRKEIRESKIVKSKLKMKILEIFGNIWSVMIEIMYAVDMAYNLCKWGK